MQKVYHSADLYQQLAHNRIDLLLHLLFRLHKHPVHCPGGGGEEERTVPGVGLRGGQVHGADHLPRPRPPLLRQLAVQGPNRTASGRFDASKDDTMRQEVLKVFWLMVIALATSLFMVQMVNLFNIVSSKPTVSEVGLCPRL